MQKQNRDARFLYIFVIKWNLYVLELTIIVLKIKY